MPAEVCNKEDAERIYAVKMWAVSVTLIAITWKDPDNSHDLSLQGIEVDKRKFGFLRSVLS